MSVPQIASTAKKVIWWPISDVSGQSKKQRTLKIEEKNESFGQKCEAQRVDK